jgi:hypothetical protein
VIAAAAALAAVVLALQVGASGPDGTGAAAPAGDASPPLPSPAMPAVTMADREAALAAMAHCIEQELGVHVTVIPGEGLRLGTLAMELPDADGTPDAETPRHGHEVSRACSERHMAAVEQAWQEQRGTPTPADVEQLHRRLEACVAAGGVAEEGEVGGGAFVWYANPPARHVSIARDDLPKYYQCAQHEEELTGLKPPPPVPGDPATVAAWVVGAVSDTEMAP